jgi:hypothetical protein
MKDDDLYLLCNPATEAPEVLLARLFKSDLNVDINPQALRMFVRTRFSRLSPLTHAIHDA